MKTSIRHYSVVFCVTALVLLAGTSISYGQQDSSIAEKHHYWINIGFGGSSHGISSGAIFSYRIKGNLISFRFIYNEELNILGPSPSESVWEFGLLYGINTKASYGLASISGGISMVGGVRRGKYLSSEGWFSSNYEKLTFMSIGIPIEGQLFWTPFSFLGVGIYAFANLNTEGSFAGALICLQLGILR